MRLQERLASPLLVGLLLGLAVLLLIFLLRVHGLLQFLELYAYDRYIGLTHGAADRLPPIVVVGITEEDIGRWGWPLSDEILARALEGIERGSPSVIGLDVYRDVSVAPGTEALGKVLERHHNIVAVYKFPGPDGRWIAAPAALRGTQQVGFNDVVVDEDGVVRRGLLFLDDGQRVYWAFALRLALRYLGTKGIQAAPDPAHPQYLRLGKTTIPPLSRDTGGYADVDDRGYQFLLDYGSSSEGFAKLDLSEVIATGLPDITGSIVLLGVTADSVKDHFQTPVATASQVNGVVLHGMITAQLIRMAVDGVGVIGSPGRGLTWAWIGSWTLLGSVITLFSYSVSRLLLSIAIGTILLLSLTVWAFQYRYWLPVVPPLLGLLLAAGLTAVYRSTRERTDRLLLMRLFSGLISPDVADAMWRARDELFREGRLRSQMLTATVLFTDIEGFTTLSEDLPPDTLMVWLNRLMGALARLVIQHHGVVDKFIGDALMAIFGVPIPRTSGAAVASDAVLAVRCALAMEDALRQVNADSAGMGLPQVRVRIGVHTGPVVAGSLGSAERLDYTVIGDTVNIASRLEGYREMDFPEGRVCRLLVSEETHALLGGRFVTEYVGDIRLKGKARTVSCYRVLRERAEGRTASGSGGEDA